MRTIAAVVAHSGLTRSLRGAVASKPSRSPRRGAASDPRPQCLDRERCALAANTFGFLHAVTRVVSHAPHGTLDRWHSTGFDRSCQASSADRSMRVVQEESCNGLLGTHLAVAYGSRCSGTSRITGSAIERRGTGTGDIRLVPRCPATAHHTASTDTGPVSPAAERSDSSHPGQADIRTSGASCVCSGNLYRYASATFMPRDHHGKREEGKRFVPQIQFAGFRRANSRPCHHCPVTLMNSSSGANSNANDSISCGFQALANPSTARRTAASSEALGSTVFTASLLQPI